MANPKVSGEGFEWLKRQGFDETKVYEGSKKSEMEEQYKVGYAPKICPDDEITADGKEKVVEE